MREREREGIRKRE